MPGRTGLEERFHQKGADGIVEDRLVQWCLATLVGSVNIRFELEHRVPNISHIWIGVVLAKVVEGGGAILGSLASCT